MTVSRTWKLAEQRLAELFGTIRRPLSGMNSRSGGSDDGMHETLYLENKLRERHAVWTLFREVKQQAKKEGKVPVIGLQEKHKPGVLLVIHSDDLPDVLKAYAKAKET